MLKHSLLAGLLIALAQRGAPAPGPCRMGTGGILDARLSANSLEDVIEAATLIVDAYVQTTGPIPGRRSGETQVLLTVANVLKGRSVQQFAMLESNASNAFQMQPGERYILFLIEASEGRQALLPARPGILVYDAAVPFSGAVCVDGDKARTGPAGSQLKAYEGGAAQNLLADIRAHLNLVRVSGRFVGDGVALPAPPRSTLRLVAGRTIVQDTLAPPIPAAGRVLDMDRDRTFTLAVEEGDHRLTVGGLPFGYFVKSLTYGDTNLIEQPLRVKAPMSSEIVIVLTDKAPPSAPATFRVRGRITGAPADPITVTLTAEGPDLRMAQAIATASREFEFVKIPPGSYRLEVTVSSAQVPGRLIWPGKSTASLTVAGQDVAVDLPAFPGKEIQFEVVTPAGERLTGNYRVRIARSATDLQFVPINDGTFRAWLPNGGFTITVQRVPTSPGGRAGAPGQIQLGNPTSLKIDDATPAAPVRITVE